MLNWIAWNKSIFIKMDLALNNLQRLICHKTQPTIFDISIWQFAQVWHDLGNLLCVGVPVRESLCVDFVQKHTKGLSTRSPTRPEADEGRKVPKISRHERAVKRKTQSAEGSSRYQSTEQASQEMWVGQGGGQLTQVRKATARACWPTDAGVTNARS